MRARARLRRARRRARASPPCRSTSPGSSSTCRSSAGAGSRSPPRAVAADGRRLRERLDRGGITVLQATPATWRMLLDAGWSGHRGLKALVGGEALPPDLVAPLLRAGGVAVEHVRPDRDDDLVVGRAGRRPGRAHHRRPPDREHHLPRARPARPAGRRRRGRRAVHRRWRARGRLPRSPGPHRGALRPRSVQRRPGARMYRTGDLARVRRGRPGRASGTPRPPGQDQRIPDRAGRDRGGARRAPGGPAGGRRRARATATGERCSSATAVDR